MGDKGLKIKKQGSFGKNLGFAVMYLIFSFILYFILTFLKKIPENWGFFHIFMITLFLVLLGTLIRFLLK